MPVSDMSNVPAIMQEVQLLQPKSILDLGMGLGKYGVLCREVLDGVHGRCDRCSWETLIVGVEGFAGYQNPIWNAYDVQWIKDFRKSYIHHTGYDLVLMIDSLEHVERTEALTILETLVQNNKHVIVSVPVGDCPQGACFGNELETHRSTWKGPEDFSNYKFKVLHRGVCCVVSIKGGKQ